MADNPSLVTGAGGFIGSHLVEQLLRRGRRVRAFVRYTSGRGIGWLRDVDPELRAGLEIVYGDIQDPRAVREAVDGCERVFHLAALISVPYSYVAPIAFAETNVRGTLNVLEAARDRGVSRVVVTSTSEVYGTARYTPIDEQHPLQAQSPYSASKIGADALAYSYHCAFGLPVAVVRPFNTYGPRQSARAVIPTVITQALAGDTIRIGNLAPIRDFVFVDDTAAGFIDISRSDACVGKVTNLATGVGVTVGDVIALVSKHLGRSFNIVETDERKRPAESEVYELRGSAAAARQRAGWEPRVSLGEGLAKTIDWCQGHLSAFQIGGYDI
ncbi:MAG: GDP-mannose 4,6-dehydratase [Thermoguttaceae bacterium]|jgi:NAD dependent epimerase/dehydratase